MDVVDGIQTIRYAYVPSMIDELDLAVGELFEELPASLDEGLRFDPNPKTNRSAYRGDVGQTDQTFHGHAFGDALTRATRAVQGISRGTVLLRDVKAYGWPLLWLRYTGVMRKGNVALLTSPKTGRLEAVVADD
jgi:hypothetical protein